MNFLKYLGKLKMFCLNKWYMTQFSKTTLNLNQINSILVYTISILKSFCFNKKMWRKKSNKSKQRWTQKNRHKKGEKGKRRLNKTNNKEVKKG